MQAISRHDGRGSGAAGPGSGGGDGGSLSQAAAFLASALQLPEATNTGPDFPYEPGAVDAAASKASAGPAGTELQHGQLQLHTHGSQPQVHPPSSASATSAGGAARSFPMDTSLLAHNARLLQASLDRLLEEDGGLLFGPSSMGGSHAPGTPPALHGSSLNFHLQPMGNSAPPQAGCEGRAVYEQHMQQVMEGLAAVDHFLHPPHSSHNPQASEQPQQQLQLQQQQMAGQATIFRGGSDGSTLSAVGAALFAGSPKHAQPSPMQQQQQQPGMLGQAPSLSTWAAAAAAGLPSAAPVPAHQVITTSSPMHVLSGTPVGTSAAAGGGAAAAAGSGPGSGAGASGSLVQRAAATGILIGSPTAALAWPAGVDRKHSATSSRSTTHAAVDLGAPASVPVATVVGTAMVQDVGSSPAAEAAAAQPQAVARRSSR